MIYPIWRLSENGPDNLGLACTDDGLVLGRTPLIERRGGRFVVRDRGEIARLLKYSYRGGLAVDRLMPGLATVAAALNANDPCLARIAGVHLRIPDLPSAAARDALAAEDALIKYARDEGGGSDWNPALHPRTGTPPNSGWFAPTDGESESSSRLRVAENQVGSRRSDVGHTSDDKRARLPPGEYIDELGDFLEWLANATPEDERTIRAEIQRYYYGVGDMTGGHQLNAALSDVIEPGVTLKDRQEILNGIAPYAHSDPAEVGRFRALITGAIVAMPAARRHGAVSTRGAHEALDEALEEPDASDARSRSKARADEAKPTHTDEPSEVWSYGWGRRGREIHEEFSDGSLPPGFPTIDNFTNGIADSIKSSDLRAATYQNASRLTSRVSKYVYEVEEFNGAEWGNGRVVSAEIKGRLLTLIVPRGSMTAEQTVALNAVRAWAKSLNKPVEVKVIEF